LRPGFEPALHQFSEAMAFLPQIIDLDVDEAFVRIVAMAEGKGSRPISLATRGFSLTAVTTAIYFFLTGFDSYEETLLDTISEGGNTDTLGCLVGGLLGAMLGESAIPREWRESLKNANAVALRGEAMVSREARNSLSPLVLSEAPLFKPCGRDRNKGGHGQRGGPPRGGDRQGRDYRGHPPRGGDRGGSDRRGPPGRGPYRERDDRDRRGPPSRGPRPGGPPRRGPDRRPPPDGRPGFGPRDQGPRRGGPFPNPRPPERRGPESGDREES
jgi:hypothetical protein